MNKLGLCITLSLVLLVPLAASAKVHEIQVTDTEFTPPSLNVKVGDTVRWIWTSGTHTIISGLSPEDEHAGDVFGPFALTSEAKEFEVTFDEIGEYPYFSQEKFDSMVGVISVASTTPVNQATWGFLKSIFEGSGSPNPRSR